MELEVLGAHMTEQEKARPPGIILDGVLALDAGSLSGISITRQLGLQGILLSHYHYDHVRDIPVIGMNISGKGFLTVYSTQTTLEVLSAYLLDGKMYPDFRNWPDYKPALKLVSIEPLEQVNVAGYQVMAVPVSHSVPAVGYQVSSPDGKSIFYTGDTGPGLAPCWEHVSPDLLITELSMPDRMQDWAIRVTHLTPALLKKELDEFHRIKGYLPRVLLVHLNPDFQEEATTEVAQVAGSLGVEIRLAYEGMKTSI